MRVLAISLLATAPMIGAIELAHSKQTSACGSLKNNYGPFKLSQDQPAGASLIKDNHCTTGVETLARTKSSYLASDVHFTLMVFPNHHRTLITIQRITEREKD